MLYTVIEHYLSKSGSLARLERFGETITTVHSNCTLYSPVIFTRLLSRSRLKSGCLAVLAERAARSRTLRVFGEMAYCTFGEW